MDPRVYGADNCEAFDHDEVDEGLLWASEAAESSGRPHLLVWCLGEGVYRAGPVDTVLPEDHVIVAAYDADGAPTQIEPVMFESCPQAWYANAAKVLDYNQVGTVDERVIKRRSVYDRRHALRKKTTVMDKNRRRVARNAKLWRLKNKSKAKRYGSLYHGPKTKVKEAAVDVGPEWRDVVVSADGEVLRAATEAEVLEAIHMGSPLIVERRRVRA